MDCLPPKSLPPASRAPVYCPRRVHSLIGLPVIILLTASAPLCAAGSTTTQGGAAGTSRPADSSLQSSVSQYGITWTFDKKAPVGQFVNGDYWFVGPVTVVSVDPAPTAERNGSVVNPTAVVVKYKVKQGYDKRINDFDANVRASFPLELAPGQSLVSVISREEGAQRPYLRTAAVLTCLKEAPPSDAFRPAYVGDRKVLWRAGPLRRDLLPRLAPPAGAKLPDLKTSERSLQRMWLDTGQYYIGEYLHPVENMPSYPREMSAIVSNVGLLLLLDDPKGEREQLLRLFVQLGIDLWGITQSESRLWIDAGGHGSGRKWPILFAGLMLGEKDMCHVKAAFAEDYQTYYGNCWTGAKVCWGANHADAADGDHEEKHPRDWTVDGRGRPGDPKQGSGSDNKAESYRRGCSSQAWVGEALAARLLGMVETWDHPAFFDYMDRWMYEDETEFTRIKTEAVDWKREVFYAAPAQRTSGSAFVDAMWAKYRPTLQPPPDGWKKERKDRTVGK